HLGQGQGQTRNRKIAHAEPAPHEGTSSRPHHVPFGQPGKSSPTELSVSPAGLSPRYSGRLVGGQEIQLYGLPPAHSRPEDFPHGHGPLPGRAGTASSQAPHGRRARRSRVAAALPEKSVTQRHGHQSQWRALLSAGPHAHFLLLRKRAGQACPLLPGAFTPALP